MTNTRGGSVRKTSHTHTLAFRQVGVDVQALYIELQERPALGMETRSTFTF